MRALALTLNQRLRHAQFVHTITQRGQVLLDRIGFKLADASLGQIQQHETALLGVVGAVGKFTLILLAQSAFASGSRFRYHGNESTACRLPAPESRDNGSGLHAGCV